MRDKPPKSWIIHTSMCPALDCSIPLVWLHSVVLFQTGLTPRAIHSGAFHSAMLALAGAWFGLSSFGLSSLLLCPPTCFQHLCRSTRVFLSSAVFTAWSCFLPQGWKGTGRRRGTESAALVPGRNRTKWCISAVHSFCSWNQAPQRWCAKYRTATTPLASKPGTPVPISTPKRTHKINALEVESRGKRWVRQKETPSPFAKPSTCFNKWAISISKLSGPSYSQLSFIQAQAPAKH